MHLPAFQNEHDDDEVIILRSKLGSVEIQTQARLYSCWQRDHSLGESKIIQSRYDDPGP